MTARLNLSLLLFAVALAILPGCRSNMAVTRERERVALPIPASQPVSARTPAADGDGDEESANSDGDEWQPPEMMRLDARALIPLAFSLQPDIKSSYQQFKSEEARYDFFYASNDSFTPRFSTSNRWTESRDYDFDTADRTGARDRNHVVEFGVDKQFFDTTEMSLAVGYDSETYDGDFGNQPYVRASLRYPLWESREKLKRTSEDIFRRNELDDAQLAYIKQVRSRLQRALIKFYTVIQLRSRVGSTTRWHEDLEALIERLDQIDARDTSDDRRRIDAELTRVAALLRNAVGRFEIETAHLKNFCGLPYETELEIDEAPFNPFVGATHERLRRVTLEHDPELATLRNAMRNAEVQLDLARRGKWDVALLLDGQSDLRGRGALTGDTQWSVAAGLEVSAIDSRVTQSLLRQARANITRFKQAIASRESRIYAETLEPLVRIETLGASRAELEDNVTRYRQDYETGLREYLAGELNIDDLLKRRENVYGQEEEIARLSALVGMNVAELCAATNKFFELLDPLRPNPHPSKNTADS